MTVITIGATAPAVQGVDLTNGTRALFFYKVTCPVCQMAGPIAQRLEAAYPGTVAGVGQDPEAKLSDFAREYAWTFDSTPDLPPYEVSEAYGIRVVPTVVLVQDNSVADVVESWDRDGYHRLSSELAGLTGRSPVALSQEGDGLPSFRPG
jgi:hypothetical protein